MNYGDIALGATLEFLWPTSVGGVPTTLAGSPSIAVYEAGVAAEITAGCSITVDYDGKTGQNRIVVAATALNGFATAKNYTIQLAAGTVDGITVAPRAIAIFSIENRYDAAFIRLGLPQGASVSADIAALPAAIWAVGTRTLTSFGTLVADVATAVWAAGARTLTAFGFSTGIPTANENADAYLDRTDAFGTGITPRKAGRLQVAHDSGKTTGPTPGQAGTVAIRNPADSKDVVSATVDANGYRTAVTRDLD